MSEKKITLFIATFEKTFGVNIIKSIPHLPECDVDLHYLTMTIFLAYENFFEVDEAQKQKRISFRLPFKNLMKKATIVLDRYEDPRNEKESYFFITSLLFPDYFPDENSEDFDKLLNSIASEYISDKDIPSFKGYFKECQELFFLKQRVQDKDYNIENYSRENALIDFKKAMQLFSKKQFEQAYFLLRKAHLRFEADNELKLLLETNFFLGTILFQLNKFKEARDYYGKLHSIARDFNHQKYLENGLFMEGYCNFKLEDYEEALQQFRELNAEEIRFVDGFKFYYLYGRTLRLLDLSASALKILNKALIIREEKGISTNNHKDKSFKEKQGNLFLEIGNVNYQLALKLIQQNKIEKEEFDFYLKEAINYYKKSNVVWEEIERFGNFINTCQLIAGVYEALNEIENAIEHLRQALRTAEETNDLFSRFLVFKKITQNLLLLGRHDLIIKEVDEMLAKIVTFAFVELSTIAEYHEILGTSLLKVGKKKEALSELLIALNINSNALIVSEETISALEKIIEIYEEGDDQKYIDYYSDQLNQHKKILQKKEEAKKKKLKIFTNIKEFWIFLNEGLEIYSYVKESKLSPELFGGFISAIQMFSMELTKKNIKSISIGFDKYSFYRGKDYPIYIVGRSSLQVSEKDVQESLKRIYEEFWSEFQEEIEHFDSRTNKYLKFEEKLALLKQL